MTATLDINCDLGEGYGAWRGDVDEELMAYVTSANIACGFHAGDFDIMAETVASAIRAGVAVGAHPGFPDLQGFGRRHIQMTTRSITHMVQYQLGAIGAIATAQGTRVSHLKLHGALGSFAIRDPQVAEACFNAALQVDRDIVLVVQAATPMQSAVERLDCNWATEIFVDRAYQDDGSLIPRDRIGAVVDNPALVVERLRRMLEAGAVIAESGRRLPTRMDSVCIHGDTPNAVTIAKAVYDALKTDGYHLRSFADSVQSAGQVSTG